ncbi:MAG: helix-turn-helix domain-containing protein [Candidatus Kerfeldbacteria bacterium]|nr:helix-turn-helix domain-containing protein [Candidatus Kerfeldbacteria bacterium]
MANNYISTTEAAKMLNISRIAVFRKIKNGQLKAQKVGRNYVIDKDELGVLVGRSLGANNKKLIEAAVKKTVQEYGETLKLLGQE